MRIDWLGNVPYARALKMQYEIHAEVVRGGEERVLLLEHPPVITMGKSAKPENLLVPPQRLSSLGVEIFRVERGGDFTFHGPGQLVGYFIVRTEGGKGLVERILRVLKLSLLEVHPFEFEDGPHPGVWVGGRKMASVGLAIKRGVSLHGFALNLTVDLSYFSLINPCGMPSSSMTSLLLETGKRVEPEDFYPVVAAKIEEVFLGGG